MWDIEGKTILITGGSSGVGRATATTLSAKRADVVITARNLERARQAADEIEQSTGNQLRPMELDLASVTSVRAFCKRFLEEQSYLHVLINNAGTVQAKRRETVDGLEMTFAVHYLGPFLLTSLLLDRILQSAPARIINVSSRIHRLAKNGLDFDDLQLEKGYSGRRAYAQSKLALELFTRELAARLADKAVTVNSIHPGAVITNLRADAGPLVKLLFFVLRPTLLTPEESAEAVRLLATDPALQTVTGQYFSKGEQAEPSEQAQDIAAAKRLWEATENLLASLPTRGYS
ncbi:MAG: SDR family oxidoreductase [Myxococcales bacterium]|nr:SDR family oxidoreductase [Myxococcales bacterium]MDH3485072.1 SDR family oxidoreductase [Myxococcales bacterium]